MYTLKRALYDIWQQRFIKRKMIKAFFEDEIDNTDDFMAYMSDEMINHFYSHWKTMSARRYKQHFMRIVESLIKERIKNMAYFDFVKAVQPQMVANLMIDTQPIQADLGKIFLLKSQYIGGHNV